MDLTGKEYRALCSINTIYVNETISILNSLIDADGFQRTVEYTADDHNGLF